MFYILRRITYNNKRLSHLVFIRQTIMELLVKAHTYSRSAYKNIKKTEKITYLINIF